MVPALVPTMPPPALVHLIDTVELLLTEMITNAVRYGGGANVARLITVASGHGVRVVVCDGEEAEPVVITAAAGDEGGRGMWLVATLSAGWGVCRCMGWGKCVWADLTDPAETHSTVVIPERCGAPAGNRDAA